MKVKIRVDAWERETYRSPEAYGDWSAEGGINDVVARRASDEERYGVYDLDVRVGDYVFAVVAHYGTGDTFGHCSGGQTQVIGAYRTVEDADRAKELCELYTSDREAYDEKIEALVLQGLIKRPVVSRLDSGLVIDGVDIYPYWTGFFESLNEIKIWMCRVEP